MRVVTAALLLGLLPCRYAAAGDDAFALPHSMLVAQNGPSAPTSWGTGGENPDEPERHHSLMLRLEGGLTGLAVGGVGGAIAAVLVPAFSNKHVVNKSVALDALYGGAAGFLVGFLLGGE